MAAKGMRRFFDRVGVRSASASEWFVTLDGRDIRTPAKKPLLLPTEGLAWAIAAEWEGQPQKLNPGLMPLMTLATTTIDQFPSIRENMTSSMLRSLESDASCLRSMDEPALMTKEAKAFDPLHSWLAEDLRLKLSVTDSLFLQHPPEALPRATQLLADADDWQLAALDYMTSSTKSLVVSLALARGRISAREACVAARMAELHQIEEWGEVEMGHDLDAADCAVRLSASSAFLRLLGDRPWKDSQS